MSARSTISAGSPVGMACRRRSCARRSFSRVAALAVNLISRLLWREAAASRSRWLSSVRCGASRRTVVRFTAPSDSRSRTTGNLLVGRAASMRLYVSCSDRRRTSAAVGEERREARAQVEPARVQLRHVSDQVRRGFTLAVCEPRHLGDQLGVGEMSRDARLHGALSVGRCQAGSVHGDWDGRPCRSADGEDDRARRMPAQRHGPRPVAGVPEVPLARAGDSGYRKRSATSHS